MVERDANCKTAGLPAFLPARGRLNTSPAGFFIGVVEVKIISGKQPHARRTLLYGVHGVGKSTWASQSPSPIFLDIEDGLNDIACQRTQHQADFEMVMESLRWLFGQKHDFKTLVIDTIDWLEQLIFKEVAREQHKESISEIPYGKGYDLAVARWNKVFLALDFLRRDKGMHVIALCHCDVVKYTSPEADSYDRYQPALHKSSVNLWQEWCDEVLFANYRVYTKKTDEGFGRSRTVAMGAGERFIQTSETATAMAKNRLGLPQEIEFTWADYAKHFQPANISGVVVEGSSKVQKEKVQNG